MSTNTNINVRMDAQLKKDFEEVCSQIGMSMSTAFSVFARKVVKERGMPFDVSLRSRINRRKTLKVLNDVKKGKNLRGPFDTVEELFEDLNA